MSPTRSTRRALTATTVAAALTMAAGCGDDGSSAGDPDAGLEQVTYLTGFGCSPHDSFMFVAEELGYFDDAGIEVALQPGGGTGNYHALLADQAQFTYVDFTGMLLDIGGGEFTGDDFVALSAVHHSTLVAILAPESAGIESPQDLEGKRIGAFAGSPTETLLPAYAELTGWEFDPGLVVQASIQELFGLLPSGNADALSSFIIQKGVIAGAAGEPLVEFPFNQVLGDLLGTGVITTSEFAEENPEAAVAFRDAALEGLRYTIQNPEEAIEILENCDPGVAESAESYVSQIQIMEPYITSEGEDRIGVLDEDHVRRCITMLENAGLVPSGLQPDDIVGEQTLLTS